MTAVRYSRSHEKEEKLLLGKGIRRTWAAFLLCWVPVIGLLLSVSGYLRVMVRLTRKYRRKRAGALTASFLVMLLCTSVLLGEAWAYSRDPDIVNRGIRMVWTAVVGEENASRFFGEQENAADGTGDPAEEDQKTGDAASEEFDWDAFWNSDTSEWTDEDWAAAFGGDEWLDWADEDGDGFIPFEDVSEEGFVQGPSEEGEGLGSLRIGKGTKITLPVE
ncbi:MAG: hypothetical protein J5859_00800 [Clostridia bacterium]|nr:hypothetical protein [Clostridia bacterium]